MPHDQRIVRRVSWKVVRAKDGWKPIVLIGEEPIHYRCEQHKSAARAVARAQCSKLRKAGQ